MNDDNELEFYFYGFLCGVATALVLVYGVIQ
jgi:hypothetical protein